MIICQECNTENMDGALYCENCGADLDEMLVPVTAGANSLSSLAIVPLKLIVAATGEEIPLPDKDEIILGREDPVSSIFPDIELTAYGAEEDGVSRKHARITHHGDTYFIEDLQSVNLTFLNKEKLAPNTPCPISDGDELMLGRLKFQVVLS